MRHAPRSNLGETGATDLAPGLADALLGNAHQRKNRGRYGLLAGPQQMTVLELTGDDQLAAGCQISCSVIPVVQTVPGSPSISVPAILGTLRWGTDGASQELQFDWLQGVVLNVAGSYAQVSAQNVSVVEDEVPLQVQVGATIGYFPHGQPLRRTYSDRGVGIGALVQHPVPPFAREVEILQSPQAACIVAQLDRTGYPLAIVSSAFGVRMPIVPDCATVSVLNTSLAVQNQINTIYHLWV